MEMDFIIINAIKKLKERIEVLEAENERLKANINMSKLASG